MIDSDGLLRIAPRAFLGAGPYIGYDRAARAGCATLRAARLDRRVVKGDVRGNLRRYFPDADDPWIKSTALRIGSNALRARLFDKYFLPEMDGDQLDSICRWRADAPLRQALADRTGVVVVSLHYGRFWAAPVWLSRHGFDVLAFQVGEGRLPAPDRTLSGGSLNASDLSAPLRAVRALRRGAVVCIQLDAGRVERPLVVDFLGRPTRLPRSPIEIARAAGALVIPVLAVPSRDDTDVVDLVCYTPVDAAALPDDERPEVTMRRLIEPLERQVRRDPANWFAVANAHRRLA